MNQRDEKPLREHNSDSLNRAVLLLNELVSDALVSSSSKCVYVRIPVHGVKLGRPVGAVERE